MTFAPTPTLPAWAEINREAIAPLAEADPFGAAQYLVSLAPKCSAKDLASELARLGGPQLTKREASAWREQCLQGAGAKRPAGTLTDEDGAVPDAPTARARLADAIRLGDANGALRWSKVVMAQQETGTPDGAVQDGPDFSLLTDVQLSCFHALCDIAAGKAPDAEGTWWRTLLGRVPGQRSEIHPAHIPLPAGGPIPPRLSPAKIIDM